MRRVAKIIAGVFVGLMLTAPARAADAVTVSSEAGYVRLLFTLAPTTSIQAKAEGSVLTITFGRRIIGLTSQNISAAMPNLFANGRLDPDGKAMHFALVQSVKLHTSTVGSKSVVDIAPLNFAGVMPDLPLPPPPAPVAVDTSSLPVLKLRSGTYPNFTRLVFDFPKSVSYSVFPGAAKIGIRFETLVKPDLSPIARQAPPWVKNASWRIDGKGTVVEFETDADSGYHDFRDGTNIVIDVLAPKSEAYVPPGGTKVQPTMLPKDAKAASGITQAQAKEIADAAAKLAAKNAPAAKPEAAKPEIAAAPPAAPEPAKPEIAAAEQPPVTPGVMATDSRLTKDGVVLTFKGAGVRGSAVFIRGLSAWIVLQGAPGFDTKALKDALGNYPAGIDAASGGDVATLRITLKAPAQIAARTIGADLKVVIASNLNDAPIAIGFARNQDDPTRASLTTVLPGAERAIPLLDPVTGDTLTVIPAASGRAMLAPRSFVEFSTLTTASGLVLMPYIDNLDVTVTPARVTITKQGGLSLTLPQMPTFDSPTQLAQKGDGPSYLDFAKWGQITGGSFLATQRRLRMAAANLKADAANPARQTLARFYLANGFAPEALGIINLMQDSDPSLEGNAHLATMRAAAEYMMGRYTAAHNELAGSSFDSDRHAAFWRGLIEAARNNWDAAHNYFSQAQSVMRKYPLEWQAKAHIADAEAALGMGRLELADAALGRVPKSLPKNLLLESELIKARVLSAENRYKASAALFDGLIKVGEPYTSASAIFYETTGALRAGAIDNKTAIAELEKLRYRWRGDALEMAVLQKLGQLYFDQQDWRKGLGILQVANESFPNSDLGRQAQDQMRAAFADLFLNGKADKMKPIEAVALFYDYQTLQLAPLGADGDTMVRRMADRLVTVDLLGSAADLLKWQIEQRLQGQSAARAKVAVSLAMIQLRDHKPQDALDTLQSTRVASLPDVVNHDRLLLEARALADLKKWDDAVELIAVDEAPDTQALRSDIYWQGGKWDLAGQQTEKLLADKTAMADALSADDRKLVLRAAISYSLANDQDGLDRLKSRFGDKMKTSPDASAFAVVTERIDMQGTAFRDAAAKIASINTLDAFMKDMKARETKLASN